MTPDEMRERADLMLEFDEIGDWNEFAALNMAAEICDRLDRIAVALERAGEGE